MAIQFGVGQQIKEKFVVISKEQKVTSKGDPYLVLELSNKDGRIGGKVWSDSMGRVNVEPQDVVEVTAKVDSYRGSLSLVISQAVKVEGEVDNFVDPTPTLVFDIETVGMLYDDLNKKQQEYFWDNLEKKFEGTDEQKKDRTGLYPLFGYVVAIGMYNPNTGKGQVLYWQGEQDGGEESKQVESEDENFSFQTFATEKELLERFWELAQKYERYVTYNGNGFDWPYLVFRSGINRVKVPFEPRGSSDTYLDLATKIRMNYRSFKLEQLCLAFGISNPKQDGVSGMEVARLHREGKLTEILDYVARDVVSTSELYDVWREYLAGKMVV